MYKSLKLIFSVLFFLAVIFVLFTTLTNLKDIAKSPDNLDGIRKPYNLIVFGNNSYGQLGDPSITEADGVNGIMINGTVDEISSGRNYTIVKTAEGRVYTWGGNEWGQLGYETTGTYFGSVPRLLQISNVNKISASNNHTLILDKEGKVYAFGSNYSGQLGSGDNSDSSQPKVVSGLPGVTDIAAGYKFSLALTTDGSVMGWGATCDKSAKKEALEWWKEITGNFDTLDNGGYYDPTSDALAKYDMNEYCINEEIVGILSTTPVPLVNLKNIKKISAGYGHALALDNNGEVWSFGCNTYKQLGRLTDNRDQNTRAGKIPGISQIKNIAAGYRHSLVLKDDGTVWGWGLNNHGQLGTDTPGEMQVTPIQIPIADVEQIVAGFDYSLAIKNDGTVWGWGMNRQKWFENSDKEFITTPTQMSQFSDIIKLAANGGHLVAIPKSK